MHGKHQRTVQFSHLAPFIKQAFFKAFFTVETENCIKKFQEIFNLPKTGIVDRVKWNKLQEIYKKTLNNLPKKYKEYIDNFFEIANFNYANKIL